MADIYDQKYDEMTYARMFMNVFPPGKAFPRHEDDNDLFDLSRGHALELERIDIAVSSLVQNGYPSHAVDFLSDWEKLLGLPDDADAVATSTSARQATIVKRLITIGQLLIDYGLNATFFIQLGALYSFTVTSITEGGNASRCGTAECGLSGCGGAESIFEWVVHSAAPPSAAAEAIFEKFRPAHTTLSFEQP